MTPAYWRAQDKTNRAATDHPVHELIAARWSPYAFADRPVSKADLVSLFEAARWAPSSYNEQPWSYVVATRAEPEEFARLLSCLVEGNQVWAKAAPVLALGCTRLTFVRNGQANAAAVHDLGLASAQLVLEVTARGLAVHQMIGILPDRARAVYQIPEGVQPLTGLAIGYAGDPAALPEQLCARDAAAAVCSRLRREVGDRLAPYRHGAQGTDRELTEGRRKRNDPAPARRMKGARPNASSADPFDDPGEPSASNRWWPTGCSAGAGASSAVPRIAARI